MDMGYLLKRDVQQIDKDRGGELLCFPQELRIVADRVVYVLRVVIAHGISAVCRDQRAIIADRGRGVRFVRCGRYAAVSCRTLFISFLLGFVDFAIDLVGLDQFLMCTDRVDPAVVQNDDLVRIHDG